MITNIDRLQACDSIMCGYVCIGLERQKPFVLKGKTLLAYPSLSSPNDYEKNLQIILKKFQYLKRLRWKNFLYYLG